MSVNLQVRTLSSRRVYRVVFRSDGNTIELYAERVKPSALAGFLELEGLLFKRNKSSERASMVDQKVHREFAAVERSHIPLTEVLRVDRVNFRGEFKLLEGEGTARVKQMPSHQDSQAQADQGSHSDQNIEL